MSLFRITKAPPAALQHTAVCECHLAHHHESVVYRLALRAY